MKNYINEYEGQDAFFRAYHIDADFGHRTDGVYRGCLFENKLDFRKVTVNDALWQAIIYASRIRIRGEKMPEYLIVNHLNRETAYIYKSIDLLDKIEQTYVGAASRHKTDSILTAKNTTIDYSTSDGIEELLKYVNNSSFIKYSVDVNNVYGLSQQFYKFKQDKDLFLDGENAEIRKPTILSDRIIPYDKADNLEFKSIMDCLNPALLQREQGAYYTPPAYVKEMQKMLLQAIEEVPQGMNYIIIDRCAGVGNLEEGLPDEILEHCILSTIEPNEYRILQYLFPDSVVIPNTDALVFDIIPTKTDGDIIIEDYIRDCVSNPNCAIILVENPPYSESGSNTQKTGQKENLWKDSFVCKEFKKEIVLHSQYNGVVTNELANLFIWSGFKYYLNSQYDSYILYAPTKYWRNQNLVNKKFRGGFLCDRRNFGDTSQAAATSCIWWNNIDDSTTEKLMLTPYEIDGDCVVRAIDKNGMPVPDIKISKAKRLLSEAYDLRPDDKDELKGLACEWNGLEFLKNKERIRAPLVYNENIIAYLVSDSFSIDRKTCGLARLTRYNGNGFHVRDYNFFEKLPLFVAAAFPYNRWYRAEIYSKSYDGGDKYLNDKEFLKKCLIYTCLTPKNKCRSLNGSDGRYYRNELCFDGEDTLAYKKLIETNYELSEYEKKLFEAWEEIMRHTKNTDEYNSNFRYGFWQISDEINNMKRQAGIDRQGNPIYEPKYTYLNVALKELDRLIKQYYENDIIDDLFKYELIK